MIIFTGTLKRIFNNNLCWIFLLLFPLVSYILLSVNVGGGGSEDQEQVAGLRFAVADNDNTAISKTLANQLSLRYNVIEIDEADISATLTENNDIPWVLLIQEGFENDVLNRNTGFTTLESYTLTISDVSAIGSLAAENITRSLMILGTNDEASLAVWSDAARLEISSAEVPRSWEGIAQWLSMFGFVSILTAYFVIRILADNKLQGMPDRIGALPVSPRKFLVQGTLAAFVATEISVVLTLVSLWLVLGPVENVFLIFVMMSLFNLFAVSLVLTLTSIAKTLAGASAAMSMIATLISMLGGLFWPIEMVPEIMQRIAWFSPGYWFNRGLRYIGDVGDIGGQTFEGLVMPILFLLGFTVVTLLIGGLRRVQKIEIE